MVGPTTGSGDSFFSFSGLFCCFASHFADWIPGFRSVVSLALLDLTRDESMEVTIREVGALNAKGRVTTHCG